MIKYKRGKNIECPEGICPYYHRSDDVTFVDNPMAYTRCKFCKCSYFNHWDISFRTFFNEKIVGFMDGLDFDDKMLTNCDFVLIYGIDTKTGSAERVQKLFERQLELEDFRYKDKLTLTKDEIREKLVKRLYFSNFRNVSSHSFHQSPMKTDNRGFSSYDSCSLTFKILFLHENFPRANTGIR